MQRQAKQQLGPKALFPDVYVCSMEYISYT